MGILIVASCLNMQIISLLNKEFQIQYKIYWSNLNFFSNTLLVLNISLFFVTELIIKENYYFTYYSIIFLGLGQIALLFPTGLLNRLWFYFLALFFHLIAIYFIIASVIFWIKTS